MAPPKSRKPKVMDRVSTLFRGRSSRSDLGYSQDADTDARSLLPHNASTRSIPFTSAKDSAASSVQDLISQSSKHPPTPCTANTAYLAASTSTSITPGPISHSLGRSSARDGNASLSLVDSALASGSPKPTTPGEVMEGTSSYREDQPPPSLSAHGSSHVEPVPKAPSENTAQVPSSLSSPSGAHQRLDVSNTGTLDVDHQNNTSIAKNREDPISQLNPVLDASHTRNLAKSPPNSECFPGTRGEPIREITVWAGSGDSEMAQKPEAPVPEEYTMETHPHVYWLHGSPGCGKSSVSLEVAKVYAGSGRLLASYFFSRDSSSRSTMRRFAVTLCTQMVAAIPSTAPFIEATLRAEQERLEAEQERLRVEQERLKAAQGTVRAEKGTVRAEKGTARTEKETARAEQGTARADQGTLTGNAPLAKQLDLLVLSPFQEVVSRGFLGDGLAKRPFLIVVDGLDECKETQSVENFIDHMLAFFKQHPSIPLRILISSRAERPIGQRLKTNGVFLGDLDRDSPLNDIKKVLQASFQARPEGDYQKYVQVNGRCLLVAGSETKKLIEHIGGSFLLASTVFKLILQPAPIQGPLTPMDSLPPIPIVDGLDLDGLYAQILARSQHLPHFYGIISTIVRLMEPIPTVGIADLLGIQTVEVVRVLLNTQVIVRVPGTDVVGEVTLCHASFRDFLTTETRSKAFFVPRQFHLRLSYYCFAPNFERIYGQAYTYGLQFLYDHLLALPEGCNLINEMKRINARTIPFVERVPFHTFLCSMCFYSIAWGGSQFSDRFKDLLTECTKQMALAVDHPDSRVRLWLEKELIDGRMGNSVRAVELTEDTWKTVQQHLERASTTLHAKFPGLLKPQSRPSSTEEQHKIGVAQFSGVNIFKALAWIVDCARLKWEKAKTTPRRPLELSIFYNKLRTKIIFSFDGASGGDESD